MASLPEPCCGQVMTCKRECVHNGHPAALFRRELTLSTDCGAVEIPKGLQRADAMHIYEEVLKERAEQAELTARGINLNPKDIAGSKKPQLALIPLHDDVAAVYELGARKYGPFNWRYTPIGLHAYLNAILRHANAIINGEDIDPESGKSHLAHIACTATIALDAKAKGTLREDRPTVVEIKPEKTSA